MDETNFVPFFSAAAPDGLSAIVYDEDGAIFDLLFGPGSGVLGFAGPEWLNPATGEIVEGFSFMNGGSLLGANAFPVAEFLSVQVHEFGHYQNLAHTVVNGQAAVLGTPPARRRSTRFAPPATFANRIETMYPFLLVNGGMATPHADDIAIFSFALSRAGFAAMTGTDHRPIRRAEQHHAGHGVNVIARNVANPYDDAVSAISSDFATDYTPGQPFVGVYTLRGLTPGASYAVFVDEILVGRLQHAAERRRCLGRRSSTTAPASRTTQSPTCRALFTPVVASGRRHDVRHRHHLQPPAAGADPAGRRYELRDLPAFTVRFCGQTFESVWVNANGSLTFGAGSSAFLETIAGMLTGPPRDRRAVRRPQRRTRVACISFEQTSHSLTVSLHRRAEFRCHGRRQHLHDLLHRSLLDGSFGFALQRPVRRSTTARSAPPTAPPATAAAARLDVGLRAGDRPRAGCAAVVIGLERPAVFEVFTRQPTTISTSRRFEVFTPKPFLDPFEPNNSRRRAARPW